MGGWTQEQFEIYAKAYSNVNQSGLGSCSESLECSGVTLAAVLWFLGMLYSTSPSSPAPPPVAVAQVGDKIGNLGTLISNPGIKVDWSITGQHALNRMAEKGVTQEMVNAWVANGAAIQQDSNTLLYLTPQGVAVVSTSGKLITAYGSAFFKDHIVAAVQQVFGK